MDWYSRYTRNSDDLIINSTFCLVYRNVTFRAQSLHNVNTSRETRCSEHDMWINYYVQASLSSCTCQVRYTREDSGRRLNLKLKWLWYYARVRVINYKSMNSTAWNSANTRYINRRTEGVFTIRLRSRLLNLFACCDWIFTSNQETAISILK